MNKIKVTIIAFITIFISITQVIPTYVIVYNKINVSFSNGTNTEEFNFGKYEKATINASVSQLTGQWNGPTANQVSTGGLSFSAYHTNGSLIATKTAAVGTSTLTIDLSNVTGFGYFVVKATSGPNVCFNYFYNENGDSLWGCGTGSASNLTLYQLPSPQISTNLM